MGTKRRWALWGTGLALGIVVVAAYAGGPHPQAPSAAVAAPAALPARAEDVSSADRIIAALYETISGPAGQHRDWNRLRSLFVADGRFVAVGHGPTGAVQTESFSLDEYIARATPVLERDGFWEREVARRAMVYDHIAQVFSTYESRHSPEEKPFERGINSIQLLNDGKRWWVVTVFWEPETPGHEVPARFLH